MAQSRAGKTRSGKKPPKKKAVPKRKTITEKKQGDFPPLTHPPAAENKMASRPARLATVKWVRYLYVAAGFVSLALGIIGVVTPVLPTTPFILLSGFCFARGSERFHLWIMGHKYFGPMIRAFRDEKRIPLKAKIIATVMIVVTMTATALVVRKPVAIIGMASVGVAVVIYIWTFKN